MFGVFNMKGKAKMGSITKKGLVMSLAAAALVGCATSPVPTGKDTEAFASRLIADKVAAAADAQREYIALGNEYKSVLFRKQAAIETDEVDVDYIGKPQELLQTFAYRYGYRYIESGKRIDLNTINVRMQKAPPIEVLRNISVQLSAVANIVLDKDAKTLRLIYKNPSDNKE
jgi:defect-in-organelle-trafficking protein DotD